MINIISILTCSAIPLNQLRLSQTVHQIRAKHSSMVRTTYHTHYTSIEGVLITAFAGSARLNWLLNR